MHAMHAAAVVQLFQLLPPPAAAAGAAQGLPPARQGSTSNTQPLLAHAHAYAAEEAEGAVCMDVYAAPYVTALKTCLLPDAPVAIATAAVRLAEAVLTSGMLHEDGASVQVRAASAPHPGRHCSI